jgi:hypothetical protein
MGMDLVPNYQYTNGFQINWTGWRALVFALKLLGADTSSASFSNDGRCVLKNVALDWADKIELGLQMNRLKQTNLTDRSDKDYQKYTLDPMAEDLSVFDYNLLMEFVDFCRNSGGFRQY